ncbi:unnamed protein product [Gordionus sp. m RMFG-2023]
MSLTSWHGDKRLAWDVSCVTSFPAYHRPLETPEIKKERKKETIKDKTAKTVVKALYIIVNTHQCYEINDQGREFCNNVCTEFHKYCGIVQRVTSAYHSQANGLVERVNRTILNRIAKSVLDIPTDWPDALVGVCGTYNSCIHSSTGFSPYELMYGQKPRRPLTLQNKIEDVLALPEVMAKITIYHCLKEELEIKMAHLKKITELAIQNIYIAQLKQKKGYEKDQMIHLNKDFKTITSDYDHITLKAPVPTPKLSNVEPSDFIDTDNTSDVTVINKDSVTLNLNDSESIPCVGSPSSYYKYPKRKNNNMDNDIGIPTVTHPSTNQAQRCLTSVFEREQVLST